MNDTLTQIVREEVDLEEVKASLKGASHCCL